MPGLCATTAAGLSRRFTTTQWAAIETRARRRTHRRVGRAGRGDTRRAAALTESVTIDLDTTDVEVYGRHKRGVAVQPSRSAGRSPARGHLGRHRDGAGR